MQSISSPTVVILATGGTIAGSAASSADNVGYTAGERGVAELVAAVPALSGQALEGEQLAQLDSKDMEPAVWAVLARRIATHLARPEVAGVVVTHGTDTLEETAYCLHRVLAADKPVVLTAAMRPATALSADGPRHLLDAVTLARTPGARGVLLAFGGAVYAGAELRKVHSYRLAAFDAGDAGAVALMEEGTVRVLRPWPRGGDVAPAVLPAGSADWPWVEVVTSHAGARPTAVRLLVQAGVRGLVVAATGNGTVHHALEAALREAQAAGVAVLRATRCYRGPVIAHGADALPSADSLTPAQARVALQLQLLQSGVPA